MSAIRIFWNCEAGATAVEYGLIAALMSVALIAGYGSVANSISKTFTYLAEQLNTETPAF